jgi:hypothetical protein
MPLCLLAKQILLLPYLLFNMFFSAPSLKLIDLPGLDQRIVDESMVSVN